jgi:two-component system alkaline phosphatase synthesis response regulator PhoP
MGTGADILIIDDDRDLVNSMRIILESRGYTVRSAYNGKEGLERIEEKLPDLIVLDVMMTTDTEGFDFAYKLRGSPLYREIPIVMTTGFPKKMVEEGPDKFQHILGEEWPVSRFLEKPLDPEEFLESIEAFLQDSGKA